MSQSQRSRSALTAPSRTGNRLLDLLTEADFAALSAQAEPVTISADELLAEAGEPPRHAYFPLTAAVSMVTPSRDGSGVELAVVGNEGMAGTDLLSNRPAGVHRLIGQVEGEGLRVPADAFRAMLAQSKSLSEVVTRYALTLVYWGEQNAACNLRHDADQWMCRWLLATHDRAGRDELGLSTDALGTMLGLRPPGVSLTAAVLRQAGLIVHDGRRVTVLDRTGLEAAACGCYEAAEETYRRVMGLPVG